LLTLTLKGLVTKESLVAAVEFNWGHNAEVDSPRIQRT